MGMCSGQAEDIGKCSTGDNNLTFDTIIVKHPTREMVTEWQVDEVVKWAQSINQLSPAVITCLTLEDIDGQALLNLTEGDIRDLRYRCNYNLRYGDMKRLWQIVLMLQGKLDANESIGQHHNKSK